MQLDVHVTYKRLRIHIDGLLHLDVDRTRLIGIQSWKTQTEFFIEYTLDGNSILTEYDSKELWQSILIKLATLPLNATDYY